MRDELNAQQVDTLRNLIASEANKLEAKAAECLRQVVALRALHATLSQSAVAGFRIYHDLAGITGVCWRGSPPEM